MSLGDRLKERRVMLNLSRKKLSEITYITPQALANYENGISTPKFEILISLFQSLECDANYLYQDYLLPISRQTLILQKTNKISSKNTVSSMTMENM